MITGKTVAFFVSYALLAGAPLIMPLQNRSVGVGIVIIAISWLWYNRHYFRDDITDVEFHKLHDVPHYTEEVSALVTSQWPVPVTAEGIEEANFVRTSSLSESCNSLPCHLLALGSRNGVKQVVAHCVLRETRSSRPPDLNRFLKMQEFGLPPAAVQQAMEASGLDPSLLSDKDPGKFELSPTPTLRELRNVTLSALVVKPEFRGRGLGKGMCAYAVQVASGLGAREVIGGCRDEVLSFYEKLGVKKRGARQREGIPKVRLGNEMYLTLNDDGVNQSAKILDIIKGAVS